MYNRDHGNFYTCFTYEDMIGSDSPNSGKCWRKQVKKLRIFFI